MTKPQDSVEAVLAHIAESRRGFLRSLLIGSAAIAAVPMMETRAVADDAKPADSKGTKKKVKVKKVKKNAS